MHIPVTKEILNFKTLQYSYKRIMEIYKMHYITSGQKKCETQ